MKTTRLLNVVKLIAFAVCLGAVSGAIIWLFLRAVGVVTALLWESLPQRLPIPGFGVIVCTAGGLIIGLFRHGFGDYPEELPDVMKKVNSDGHYDYSHMPAMLIGAFLPLIFASSIGPEAGLTGVIVGLCYWVGDNVKIAREHEREYSEVGEAVTLGVLFHVPLFGIFAVEEEPEAKEGSPKLVLPKADKLVLYGSAIAGGLMANHLLTQYCGAAMAGIPSFGVVSLSVNDFVAMIVYVAAGLAMAWIFEQCERITAGLAHRVPDILRETLCGLVLGVVITIVPLAAFSGEEQMGELAESFATYAPLMLMGVALVKVFLTAFCIKLGMRGGHFFPLIFACVCMGFGIGGLFFGNDLAHLVFAAGVITAACLGAQMKKPLAVALLCLLCFPLKLLFFLFLAAAIGTRVSVSLTHEGAE